MKIVMILIDGLSDDPIVELNGKTPLEAAFCPYIHYIASRGEVGLLDTAFPGFPVESLVCIMGILGYSPQKYYPNGRASFEAMARGIFLNEDDLVFRCNIISIDQEEKIITDFTANMISDSSAKKIINKIKLPCTNWSIYPGQSYRNTLLIKKCDINPKFIKCFEPHMNIGNDIDRCLPIATNPSANLLVDRLRNFLTDTKEQIKNMKFPDKNTAGMLWLWSPSIKPIWPSFEIMAGLKGAVVGGLDFLHGIAMAADMHFDIIPGATGYPDTSYSMKAKYTLNYLDKYDFILTHINAADEAAHQRDYMGKVHAIERIDKEIIGPVFTELQSKYSNNFQIIICGDHKTRCSDGKHIGDPVPFFKYSKSIEQSGIIGVSEQKLYTLSSVKSIEFLTGATHKHRIL